MQVILPFLSRFLLIRGFLADTRLPRVKPAAAQGSFHKHSMHHLSSNPSVATTYNKKQGCISALLVQRNGNEELTGGERRAAGQGGAGEAGDGGGGGGHVVCRWFSRPSAATTATNNGCPGRAPFNLWLRCAAG